MPLVKVEIVIREDSERLSADSIARVLSRPRENVHLIFAAHGKDRVAFGGKLVTHHSN
ncbi:MAG: hypothetical protein ACR2PZ_19715 [Pseudomonadales bacterium]